ncbi:MAG TPA: 50S ribosomal protein L10 [Anaerolineae bacterium]|nr:50S ribosomal protein L10 [Anaerolineae bacterium]
MPLTKERKAELVSEYAEWLRQSSAVIMAEFPGVAAKDLYALRVKLRETHSQLHVVKLTLFARALAEAGLPVPEDLLAGSLIIAFAHDEPPAVAKTVMDFANTLEPFRVKGGLLGDRLIDAAGVKMLAELPPKPIVLAALLGTLQSPLSQIVNVLNAPLRELVQVLKARSEQGQAETAAA